MEAIKHNWLTVQFIRSLNFFVLQSIVDIFKLKDL